MTIVILAVHSFTFSSFFFREGGVCRVYLFLCLCGVHRSHRVGCSSSILFFFVLEYHSVALLPFFFSLFFACFPVHSLCTPFSFSITSFFTSV